MRINGGNGHPVSRGKPPAKSSAAARPDAVQPQPGYQPPPPPIQTQYDEIDFLTGKGETPGTCRWPDSAFPLKLWLEKNPALPEFEPDTYALLAQWEFASDHKIRFTHADSPEAADIVLAWTDEATTGREAEMGHAKREVRPLPQPDGSVEGEITFVRISLLQSPLIQAYLHTKEARKTAFFATILHEFGHALGLEHSQNPVDVMYYRGFKTARLTENDVRRLKLLYR